ncbi:MAG: hypothetical protein HYS05_06900 [Acidobacteria bacterium]|nr:hypothetical protein [Acidobacteriota bacterium]
MLLQPAVASAQVPGDLELPPAVVDLRASFARFGQPPDLASTRGLVFRELPGHGWGIDVGAHWYPLRYRKMIVGLGGSLAAATAGANSGIPAPGTSRAHNVSITYVVLAPELSLNFAGSNGWSYVSGGLGPARLAVTVDATPNPERPPATPNALNYGGGARWFITDHVAFTFDIRVFAMSPFLKEGFGLLSPRMNLVFVSAGVSLK